MTTLSGRAPKDTFKDLTQISNGNAGLDSTLRPLEDGEGTQSPLLLSTTGIRVDAIGTLDAEVNATFDGGNFTYTGTWDLTGSTWTNVNIDSGTIDGTPIGLTTPSTVAGSTGSFTGILDLSAAGAHFGGTAAKNLLNDYEEDDFTPALADAASGGNEATVSMTRAQFTRIGNVVHIFIRFSNIDTTGMTGANTLFVTGLPFTTDTEEVQMSVFANFISNINNYLMFSTAVSGTTGIFRTVGDGINSGTLIVSDIDGVTSDLHVAGHYYAA